LELDTTKERAFLFGPIYHDSPIKSDAILDELSRLVEAAGGTPVGRLTQSIRTPQAATFFGQGKVEELKMRVQEMAADVAVFDEELTPAQGRNLERALCVRVIDRSELILDIFASRARTHQAKLQVELAQLKYKLPRLKRMWTHLDRIKSAIGARGPGETQIESDRRLIRTKIQEYTAKLKERSVLQQRAIQSRKDFKVSLVGYTNAGKSTLMRRLTDPNVYVADQLFATLDTLTRKFYIEDAGDCLLSDTVGFVDKLPHHLVTSFHATLSEAREADLLLHVVDSSDPLIIQHVETVERVLSEINCGELPTIVVANKTDCDGAHIGLEELKRRYPELIAVSAFTGDGVDQLLRTISEDMRQQWRPMQLLIPWQHGNTISQLGRHAKVTMEESQELGFRIDCEVSDNFAREHQLENFVLA
jgi:GTP-binding protein HflX